MVVTDQINALRALGTDPIRKLVVPRVIAGVLMAPILTVISDFMGILGGGLIATQQLQVASSVYWKSITDGLYMQVIESAALVNGGSMTNYEPGKATLMETAPGVSIAGVMAVTEAELIIPDTVPEMKI